MSQERNINVFCRIKPIMPIENNYPEEEKSNFLNIVSDTTIKIDNKESFNFSKVFDIKTPEQEIYENSTKNMITNAFQGKTRSIICYGHCCTGKTKTIEQIISNTMKDIFKSDISKYSLKISYFEYYLNEISDLLNKRTNLGVYENSIKDLSMSEIKSFDMFNELYNKAKKNRMDLHKEITKSKMYTNVFNSHSVLTLNIFKENTNSLGKIFFIDLGGKTKIPKSVCPSGINLKEVTTLNTSLDNFNGVIRSLSKKQNTTFSQDKFLKVIKPCFDKESYLSVIIHCANLKMYKNETTQTLEMSKHFKKLAYI